MDKLLTLAINIGAVLITVIGIYKYWLLSKGAAYLRDIYVLTICMGIVNLMMNTVLVVRDHGVWAIFSLQVVIVWSIIMCIKGLMVLDNARKGDNV